MTGPSLSVFIIPLSAPRSLLSSHHHARFFYSPQLMSINVRRLIGFCPMRTRPSSITLHFETSRFRGKKVSNVLGPNWSNRRDSRQQPLIAPRPITAGTVPSNSETSQSTRMETVSTSDLEFRCSANAVNEPRFTSDR